MISGSGKHGRSRICVALSLALLFAVSAAAQDTPSASVTTTIAPVATVQPRSPAKLPESPSAHRFFNRENLWLFSGIAVMRTLDYTSTRNMQSRGREEMLLPDDVAKNTAAFAALEAAGVATSVGVSYLLHRTGHHRMERWLSIGHISITGFGAARNYALVSKHGLPSSSPGQ
jgi:hypothetical protein